MTHDRPSQVDASSLANCGYQVRTLRVMGMMLSIRECVIKDNEALYTNTNEKEICMVG